MTTSSDTPRTASLFGDDAPQTYEVHEHALLRRSGSFFHSHDRGDQPHQHEDTGPACYTIDKDDWFKATGYYGGGRKRFTKQPEGEQLAIVELEPWQKGFDVIVCAPPVEYRGEGSGPLPVLRMMKTFGMTPRVIDGTKKSDG